MYMGLQKILLIRIVKVIVPVLFVMGLFGCAYNEAKDKLIDHYQDLNISMQNYYDEKQLPTFTGKYIEVKAKNIIKYEFNGKNIYIYDLILAPIHNQTTVISGIKLSSSEYSKETDKFYYEPNDSYGKLNKENYTYEKNEQILANEYQFFLEDYSTVYGYSLTDEQFESCLTNICLTVTINGYKDKINLLDLKICDYEEKYANNEIVRFISDNNCLYSSLHAYVDVDWLSNN